MIGQINIGERPTRSLSSKYLANSKRIRDATVEYDLELITIRDFLHRVSYTIESYVNRQRSWLMNVENEIGERVVNHDSKFEKIKKYLRESVVFIDSIIWCTILVVKSVYNF